ncbi:MAG: hypothetical protein ACRBN8_19690 [Nannocystales bacterium]
MPLPIIIPIAALAIGGSLGFAFGSRSCAARNGLAFADRGWSVLVEPEDGAWSWQATKEGSTPGEGVASSKIEALDQARAWLATQQLAKLPRPKPTPEKTAPPPVGPVVEPPRPPAPAPVGGGAPPRTMPAPPPKLSELVGGGIRWTASNNSVLIEDLQEFIIAAYGASNPWKTAPVKIVLSAIQAALPQLDIGTYGPTLTVVTAQGNPMTVAEAAKPVDERQFQLNSPDVPKEAIPFAADLVHEGVFDIEQQQSKSPFAFRGRLLVARPVAGGYISTIVLDGTASNGDVVVPTVAEAIQLGIKTVIGEDE